MFVHRLEYLILQVYKARRYKVRYFLSAESYLQIFDPAENPNALAYYNAAIISKKKRFGGTGSGKGS